MTDWNFHPTLVAPFYLDLMGANIVGVTPVDEREPVLEAFRARANEVTNSQLHEMLATGSWRPQLVAVWFIAYLKKLEFRAEIERMLLQCPGHAEHLCICLSRFGGRSAIDALLGYLRGCVVKSLQWDPNGEAITPEWALCAIEHSGTAEDIASAALLWTEFIETQRRVMNESPWTRKHCESFLKSWENRLAGARLRHARIMELFDNGLRA